MTNEAVSTPHTEAATAPTAAAARCDLGGPATSGDVCGLSRSVSPRRAAMGRSTRCPRRIRSSTARRMSRTLVRMVDGERRDRIRTAGEGPNGSETARLVAALNRPQAISSAAAWSDATRSTVAVLAVVFDP
jgi:hypothetical protein